MEFDDPLLRARGIVNYQFSSPIGHLLFPDNCEIEISKRSGQIRRVLLKSKVLATIRAHDGRIVLTLAGALRLHQAAPYPRLRVVVSQEVAPFIKEGRSVFAKHIKEVDSDLRAGDEVLVVDDKDTLLAVGMAHLSPQEMLELSRGVAVKTRHSIKKRKT
ncbi:MAG: PUA domain-containing protein [Candidatus Odinarchaeota archaeon]